MLFRSMPVLLLHGAWFLAEQIRGYPQARLAAWFAPALMLAVALPSHAFLLGRANLARDMGMVPVYEWLRKPDADDARRELGLQNAIFSEFTDLGLHLPEGAVVAFYEPSYVPLLAHRSGVPLSYPVDDEGLASAARAGASHVLLTRIHPRMSRASIDGLAMPGTLPARLDLIGCGRERLGGAQASCLYSLGSSGVTR